MSEITREEMSINRDRGKALQRQVAKDLNGKNIGTVGGIDVMTSEFAIECKERIQLPKFIVKCINQAEWNAGKLIPLVVLHELGRNHDEDIVFMRWRDFKKIRKEKT